MGFWLPCFTIVTRSRSVAAPSIRVYGAAPDFEKISTSLGMQPDFMNLQNAAFEDFGNGFDKRSSTSIASYDQR